MQIDSYVQALREDLARVAALGDESTARAAELLAVALESALGRRLLELIPTLLFVSVIVVFCTAPTSSFVIKLHASIAAPGTALRVPLSFG